MLEQRAAQTESVGETLRGIAREIIAEARAAITDEARSDAVAVHDYRKAMKRWRALLRLLEPDLGAEARELREQARDLARAMAGARDSQSALDALADLADAGLALSPRSMASLRARLEAIRSAAETRTLTPALRARVTAALAAAETALAQWPLAGLAFADVAMRVAGTYRRVRRAAPRDWRKADAETLHDLRRRVVVHRYQMELVAPLWPRLGRLWVGEVQRLRDRLGKHHDLALLAALPAPRQPLAPWRARLAPLIAARQAALAKAAGRLAGRLLAEKPKAFRKRLEALWEHRADDED
ncbi:MAG: CHAD domain-containing protein [Xanthobacteraceae bacterium]|nr:CHAD domain-containing protein [Xanthobacteraceae bacterium]